MRPGKQLRELILRDDVLVAPGVYDGLSSLETVRAGFQIAFLSGAGLSFSRNGRPDLGFINSSDVISAVREITQIIDIPLIVDIDTGFGNELNVALTVERLERAGAAALQIEDQEFPKRCGHLAGKSVVSSSNMQSKIRAAIAARQDSNTVIIARTDALAVHGLQDAIERGQAYIAAGADALFLEAPQSINQMKEIAAAFSGSVPLLHNFVEGGNSPISTTKELAALNYKIALFPLAFMHAAVPAGRAVLNHLMNAGQTQNYDGQLDDLHALNQLVEIEKYL